jgi:N-acetylglucosamine kinase-like BadF-type ATPase
MNYYIGVEGGGSKTTIILVNEHDETLITQTEGPSNYHAVGLETATHNIMHGITTCIEKTCTIPQDITAIAMGLAGHNNDTDHQTLQNALNKKLSEINLPNPTIVNDAVISLKSAQQNPNAIILICGTGSNCYGVNAHGQEAWVGGLEWLISDEGSGYMMGQRALRAATQSMDGRIPHTILEELVTTKLNVPNMREAATIVHAPAFTKSKVAELALLVFEAESRGDKVAKKIIQDSINEAFLMVATAAKNLKIEQEIFDFIPTGSILHNPVFSNPLTTLLKSEYPKINLITREKPAIWGAILLARAPTSHFIIQ